MRTAILTLLFASLSFAQPVELSSLYIEVEQAIGTNRTPLMPYEHGEKAGELNLVMETSLLGLGYNITRVDSMFADSQFATVALDTESGIRLSWLEVYVSHRSQHALDAEYPNKYPNENSVGFRVRLK